MKFPIYLDYNATTPVDPRVLETMLPYFSDHYGNAASRTHALGWMGEKAVDRAREQVAHTLGCTPQEITFTSGATESINLALKGVAAAYARKGNHLVTVATEHKAVLDTCKALEKQGLRVTYLPVDQHGLIDPGDLAEAMTDETILVSIMLANNETGVIQPLNAIAELVHERGSLLMCDAVQAVGKIPVKVDDYGIDLLSISAHKVYGPKGVGALYLRRRSPRVRVLPQIVGGGHERGLRSGTLNVPGIVGLAKALEVAEEEQVREQARLKSLRDAFEEQLLQVPAVERNGHPTRRLGHVSNLAFGFVDSEGLIMAMRKLAVATGSACTSASMEPSHVLKAMGQTDDMAYASIRFSLGRFTTEEEMQFAAKHVTEAVGRLREGNPKWKAFQQAAAQT